MSGGRPGEKTTYYWLINETLCGNFVRWRLTTPGDFKNLSSFKNINMFFPFHLELFELLYDLLVHSSDCISRGNLWSLLIQNFEFSDSSLTTWLNLRSVMIFKILAAQRKFCHRLAISLASIYTINSVVPEFYPKDRFWNEIAPANALQQSFRTTDSITGPQVHVCSFKPSSDWTVMVPWWKDPPDFLVYQRLSERRNQPKKLTLKDHN